MYQEIVGLSETNLRIPKKSNNTSTNLMDLLEDRLSAHSVYN